MRGHAVAQPVPGAAREVDPGREAPIVRAEVPELVRDHRRERIFVQHLHQRPAQHEVVAVAEQAERDRHAGRLGVEILVDEDAVQRRRAHLPAQALDRRLQPRRFAGDEPMPRGRFEAHPQRAQDHRRDRGRQHQHEHVLRRQRGAVDEQVHGHQHEWRQRQQQQAQHHAVTE